jgi:hypothetical protein
MLSKRILTVSCALALLGLPAGECRAQQLAAAASAAPASAPAPKQHELDLLIRTTIIAINQANMTGNYTVFRDLTSPAFQSQNSPARLAEIFSTLRKRNLDLSPVIFFPAKFHHPPAIENGMLHATGYFPTRPERVNFDLAYQNVDGRWLLLGASVSTSPNAARAAAHKPKPAKSRSARRKSAHSKAHPPKPVVESRASTNSVRVDLPERRPSNGGVASDGAAKSGTGDGSTSPARRGAELPPVWPF